MPGTIGDDDITTKGAIQITGAEAQLQHATGTYLAASGDNAIELFFHCDTGTSGTINVDIHNLSDGNALVTSGTITCPGAGRQTEIISGAALAAVVGDTLAVSISGLTGTIWGFREYEDNAADTEDSAIMSDGSSNPFTVGGGFNQTYAFGAVITSSATDYDIDAENSSFALTAQDATLTWSWGNYYTVEPGTSNTAAGESIFGGLTINAGSRIIGPNTIGGLAATWEISGGNATGRVTLAGGPLTDPVAVSIPYYNGSTWDTISVTFADEGDITTAITAEYASFALAVQDVTLRATRLIAADHSVFALSAQDATLDQAAFVIAAEHSGFTLSAQAAGLIFSGAASNDAAGGICIFRRRRR